MNFVYNLSVTYEDVLAAVSGFIERHGKRLWRLSCYQLGDPHRLEDGEGNVTPIRCIIENVSGFIVNFRMGYQEITTDKGTTLLKSIGEKGPLHLQPVNQPYSTKESLQPKRYQHILSALLTCTISRISSRKHCRTSGRRHVQMTCHFRFPRTYLESKELVLDENDQLGGS